jgi:hypothetical protein
MRTPTSLIAASYAWLSPRPHVFDRCVNEPPLYPAAGGRASCFLLDPAERRK